MLYISRPIIEVREDDESVHWIAPFSHEANRYLKDLGRHYDRRTGRSIFTNKSPRYVESLVEALIDISEIVYKAKPILRHVVNGKVVGDEETKEEIDTTTYYTTLGVKSSASEAEIKAAYRKRAFMFHPDKYEGSKGTDLFLKVKEAYSVLSDSMKRKRYDVALRITPAEEVERHKIEETLNKIDPLKVWRI